MSNEKMNSDYTHDWGAVKNTVNDRISDDSLLHTLNADKKIKRQTKVLNQKLKNYRNSQWGYKDFLRLRRVVKKACKDDDETDDEPILTLEELKKLHFEKPKPRALRRLLRSSTRGKRIKLPRQTDKKSPSSYRQKLDESPDVKHFKDTNLPEADVTKSQGKSKTETSTANAFNLQSELSGTESSEEENARQDITQKVNETRFHRDSNLDEPKDTKKIVKELIPSNNANESVHISVESESIKVEPVDFEDNNVIVENLSQEITASEQYNVINKLNGSSELENEAEVSNDQKQNCSEVLKEEIAPNSALSCSKFSTKDYPSSEEDIFLTNDENYRSKENLDNRIQNNNAKCIDTQNHESGNNSISDTDVRKYESEKISIDKVMLCDNPCKDEIVMERYFSEDQKESISLDNIFELDENVKKFNCSATTVSLNNELNILQSGLSKNKSMEEENLSDENLDSDVSEEIPLTAPICCSTQIEGQSQTENITEDNKNKLKMRMIERYDKGYEIFSKYQLHNETKIMPANEPDTTSVEKESLFEDELSLRLRKFSDNSNLSQNESQDSNHIINHQSFIKVECTENELPLTKKKPLKLRKTSGDCSPSRNKSLCCNGLIDCQDASSIIESNEGDFHKSMNDHLHVDERQSKDSNSFKECDLLDIRSYCRNRSLNSSISSFSARSCDEEMKNAVKLELLSEIEQRLEDVQSANVNMTSQHNKSKISNRSLHDGTLNVSFLSTFAEKDSYESKILNGSLDNKTIKSSLFCSSNEQGTNSMRNLKDRLTDDDLTMADDTESLESNGSSTKSTPSKIQPQISNRASDINDSLIHPKSTPSEGQISGSKENHCTLGDTPSSRKLDVDDRLTDNKLTMEDDAQSLESNGSSRESNFSHVQPLVPSRTLDIGYCPIDLKPTPGKRRIPDNEAEDCSQECIPSSKKQLKLRKKGTNRQLELISHECHSQIVIPHELERPGAKDNSPIENREERNISRNVQHIQKKRPRPRNLEEFIASEGLIQDTTKAHFRLKDIDDDDEIWIMNVPKTIDPKDLEDRTILLGGKSELRFGDERYKISSKLDDAVSNISCILSTSRRKTQYKIANFKSKGSIKFRQKFDVISQTELISPKAAAVPFPKNLKMRHPLLGAFYKNKI